MCVLSSDWSRHGVPEGLKGIRTVCKTAFGVPQFHWDTSCAPIENYALSWFNPSQQLSTTQPFPPLPSQWGEEAERGKKKKVKLVG